jgi:hypothetical protein
MYKQILSLAYLHKHTISGMVSQESEKEERKKNKRHRVFSHSYHCKASLSIPWEAHSTIWGAPSKKRCMGGKHSMQSSNPSSTPNHAFETTKCLSPPTSGCRVIVWGHDKFQVHCMWAGLPISNMVKFNVFGHGFC